MKDNKVVIYMVTYQDDNKKNHLTFVKGFSSVRFIEDRFENVHFEITHNYFRDEKNDDSIDF